MTTAVVLHGGFRAVCSTVKICRVSSEADIPRLDETIAVDPRSTRGRPTFLFAFLFSAMIFDFVLVSFPSNFNSPNTNRSTKF